MQTPTDTPAPAPIPARKIMIRRIFLIIALLAILSGAAFTLFWDVVGPKGFVEIVPGKLYLSSQPHGDQYDIVRWRRIRRIIPTGNYDDAPDILADEQRQCQEAGATLVQIPVTQGAPSDEQIEQFLTLVNQPGATLVHGRADDDGAAALVAAFRVVVHEWSVQDALGEMRHLAPLEGAKLERMTAVLTRLAENRQQWRDRTTPPNPSDTP